MLWHAKEVRHIFKSSSMFI